MKQSLSHGSQSSTRTMFYPVFTFTDASGNVHTQLSSVGSGSSRYHVGDKVAVMYDPASPVDSKINSFTESALSPVSVTGFGMLMGCIACFEAAPFHRTESAFCE